MKLLRIAVVLISIGFSSCTMITYWNPVLSGIEDDEIKLNNGNLEIVIPQMKMISPYLIPEIEEIVITNHGQVPLLFDTNHIILIANSDTIHFSPYVSNIDTIDQDEIMTLSLYSEKTILNDLSVYKDTSFTLDLILKIPEFQCDGSKINFPDIYFKPEDKNLFAMKSTL